MSGKAARGWQINVRAFNKTPPPMTARNKLPYAKKELAALAALVAGAAPGATGIAWRDTGSTGQIGRFRAGQCTRADRFI